MKNESYFIKGFPDYRLVRLSESKFCVLSKRNKTYWKEIGSEDYAGHMNVCLVGENGVKRDTYLHVIVAELFVPNPEGKTHVHHIDFDASNNDPANLMWVTPEQHQLIHHKGAKRSDETRRKIGDALRGEKSYMYGKHHSEETRRKISERMKGRSKPEGSGRQPKPIEQLSKEK